MKRIKGLSALIKAAENGKAIICPSFVSEISGSKGFKKPTSAYYVSSLQARVVHKMIQCGLFIYERNGGGL